MCGIRPSSFNDGLFLEAPTRLGVTAADIIDRGYVPTSAFTMEEPHVGSASIAADELNRNEPAVSLAGRHTHGHQKPPFSAKTNDSIEQEIMDWKDLKPIIGGSAPLIGKLIGVGVSFIPGIGPIAGPIIGPAIGGILAGAFGVPATPEAVANAIQSNPDEVVKAKLAAATEQIKAQYAWAAAVETGELHLEEVAVTQTNVTMQAELGHEHWFFTGWRPAIGWAYFAMLIVFGALLAWVTVVVVIHAPDPVAALNLLWPIYLGYFTAAGLPVGVLIPARSIEKKAAIENGAPMPNAKPPSVLPSTQPQIPMPKVQPTLGPRPAIGKPAGSRD